MGPGACGLDPGAREALHILETHVLRPVYTWQPVSSAWPPIASTRQAPCLIPPPPPRAPWCREYSSWREEGGRFPDGRHFKNYFLMDDATGAERLVVTAEDSHRRDRWALHVRGAGA